MSGNAAPALTVVVPSVNGWGDLRGCLEALDRERASLPMEVIVPERCGREVREAIASVFPWVRTLPVPVGTPIPVMRAAAFAAAVAPTVAVIEDHVLVPSGWVRRISEARTDRARVVGGGVINAATKSTVDWAAFLCEYSQSARSAPPGPAIWLTGNNTAYDRALLMEFQSEIASGRWEDHLHDAMRRRGVTLWSRPDIVVQHKKHYTIREYAGQRFLISRAYAGTKLVDADPVRRFAYVLRTLVLPPVLLWRIVTRTLRSGTLRVPLLRALPLIAFFVIVWGAGEATGALAGEGDALARVT